MTIRPGVWCFIVGDLWNRIGAGIVEKLAQTKTPQQGDWSLSHYLVVLDVTGRNERSPSEALVNGCEASDIACVGLLVERGYLDNLIHPPGPELNWSIPLFAFHHAWPEPACGFGSKEPDCVFGAVSEFADVRGNDSNAGSSFVRLESGQANSPGQDRS